MKHCVLEDSSFVIATIDPSDKFHKDAVLIFKKLIQAKSYTRIIIPSTVFFETILTLIKNGVEKNVVEKKLWDFLYIDQIMNVTLIETMAFKMAKNLSLTQLNSLRTADYLIASTGMQFDAQILTFDTKMYERVKKIYPQIYYCSSLDGHTDDSLQFLDDLQKSIRGVVEFF